MNKDLQKIKIACKRHSWIKHEQCTIQDNNLVVNAKGKRCTECGMLEIKSLKGTLTTIKTS